MIYLNDQSLILNKRDLMDKLEELGGVELQDAVEMVIEQAVAEHKVVNEEKINNEKERHLDGVNSALYDVLEELELADEKVSKTRNYVVDAKRMNRDKLYDDLTDVKEQLKRLTKLVKEYIL